jgi:hypothetical protein
MGNSQFIGTDLTGQLDGLHAPHYFNGRLLTAEDLQADQQAVLTRQDWLGKASGYGVIEGLIVTQAGPTSIAITAGIGLNPQGEIIRLPGNIPSLPLTPQATANQPPPDAGRFTPCNFQSTGSMSSTPAGAYLLTAVPTSHFEGQVAMKAAAGSVMTSTSNGSTSSTPGCGSKWEVEGLQFRIISIPATEFGFQGFGFIQILNEDYRRNLFAHWCYGTPLLQDLGIEPFNFPDTYAGLDRLMMDSSSDLTFCDLPLAVFYWDGSKLTFVDAWAVRRRIIHPDALEGTWKALVSDKRVAENQARFLQFQNQINDWVLVGHATNNTPLSQIQATSFFGYLPPVGFLPVSPTSLSSMLSDAPIGVVVEVQGSGVAATQPGQPVQPFSGGGGGEPPPDQVLRAQIRSFLDASGNPSSGFDLQRFFAGVPPLIVPPVGIIFPGFPITLRINLIGRDSMNLILHQSWYEEAIDLTPSQFFIDLPPIDLGSLLLRRFQRPGVGNIIRRTGGVRFGPTREMIHRSLITTGASSVRPFSGGGEGGGGGGGEIPPLPTYPLVIDAYIIEENLRSLPSTNTQLYIMFHRVLQPTELAREQQT